MFGRIWAFYRDGFRQMRLGRKLWLIVAIKLFVLYFVFKLLFFPDILKENFHNDRERGDFVLQQLTREKGE